MTKIMERASVLSADAKNIPGAKKTGTIKKAGCNKSKKEMESWKK